MYIFNRPEPRFSSAIATHSNNVLHIQITYRELIIQYYIRHQNQNQRYSKCQSVTRTFAFAKIRTRSAAWRLGNFVRMRRFSNFLTKQV